MPAGRREYAELLDFGSKITVHAASQGRAPGRSHDTRMVPNPEDLPIRSREPPPRFFAISSESSTPEPDICFGDSTRKNGEYMAQEG